MCRAAAIYVNDAFVDVGYSQATADLLPGMRRWVTDEYHHNGLRTDGGRILDRLIGLARGACDGGTRATREVRERR